jgi:hypothetical protein
MPHKRDVTVSLAVGSFGQVSMLVGGMSTEFVVEAVVVLAAALRSRASREARSFVGVKHNRPLWTVLGGRLQRMMAQTIKIWLCSCLCCVLVCALCLVCAGLLVVFGHTYGM